jgi:hypothetical protein
LCSDVNKKPSKINEPEQLRTPIIKAEGSTDGERYLARIAEKSFLNLWSYPAPYRDQKQHGVGDGKELCDLLVVCGDHIIIFSEKTIAWPSVNKNVAWRRWSKNAIRDAIKQIKGAERWIAEHPERIFLDRKCKVPFPLNLPLPAEQKIHRIVVANGAADACRSSLKTASGSLIIDPTIRGDAHWPSDEKDIRPFRVGDIDPDGPLVHVLNEDALDVVMRELDTITDFTAYLTKKEKFIRSGKLAVAEGEENLVAYYSIRINDDEGVHDFVVDEPSKAITIDREQYTEYTTNPQYFAKKQADKISYLWDAIIQGFTKRMLDGTSLVPEGFEFDLSKAELAVRYMALEGRFVRRSHSEAIRGALEKGMDSDRFSRVMMTADGSTDSATAFFIQTVKYQTFMNENGGYSQYRKVRSNHLQIYAEGLLEKYPHLKRVIGIGREPPEQEHGVSEDLLYMEQVEWTEEQRKSVRENNQKHSFLQNVKERPYSGQEFPDVTEVIISRPMADSRSVEMNRQQRRALKAKLRKR